MLDEVRTLIKQVNEANSASTQEPFATIHIVINNLDGTCNERELDASYLHAESYTPRDSEAKGRYLPVVRKRVLTTLKDILPSAVIA